MIDFSLSLEILRIVIPCLFLFDVFLTWHNTRQYKKLFPKRDWTAHEVNPLVRFLWNKFGLNKGTILASTLAVGLIAILIIFYGRDFLLIALGAYIPILAIHIRNFLQLIPKRKGKKGLFHVGAFSFLFMANLYYLVESFSWIGLGVTLVVLVALIFSIRKYVRKEK